MIKFILCIPHESGKAGTHLLESVREQFNNIEQECLDRVADLKKRLCTPAYNKENEIIIAFVNNSECLEQLLGLKECLSARKVVLVLRDESRDLLSRCHLLRPRYVSVGENHFSNLVSVLKKMTNVLNAA